ncbi:general transcription factor 3C polypeptide 1 [Condylostylus longicornis]|uniref:general transcription factor 3C polypeptide 1 n=1 Tax=Condylostylus longicornis TaxID=2530218 RepID=UPI00244DB394|nr:general transcription factor 3C polypeptide 1 [Condylostylus longicornis]
MENCKKNRGPWTKIILDEIALEGLEGITIDGLWFRFEQALHLPYETPDNFKLLIWQFLKKQNESLIEFFILPVAKAKIKNCRRSDFVDPELGFPVLPDECPFDRSVYKNINEGNIRGSCEHFYERKKIPVEALFDMSLEEIKNKYGDTLVIVASQEYRESVLFPEYTQKVTDVTAVQYCVLEAIGRSRFNGEVTSGKHSISTYIKEYLDIFYAKLKLTSHQLIIKQPYMERVQGRISSGYLLTLTRFYRIYKTRPVIIIETLYNVLKMHPTKTVHLDTLKKGPPFDGISFKKLTKLPIFTKHFELVRVPQKDVDIDMSKPKSKRARTDTMVLVVKFKNENMALEDIFDSANNETSEAENIEFLSEKHCFLDMSFQEQVYRFIAKHGSTGCSQMQITRYTATNKYSVRQLLRAFLKKGYIKEYSTDVGRQRVVMYVTFDNAKNMSKIKAPSAQEIREDLKIDEEDLVSMMNSPEKLEHFEGEGQPDKLKLDKLNQVMSILKETNTPYHFVENKIICDPRTARHNQRIKLILDVLSKSFFVEKNILRKHIMSEEQKLGYKDQICSKSLYRIIRWLKSKNMARFYELSLKYNKYVKIIYYAAHIKLEPHFRILQSEILKQKNILLTTLEEREIRQQQTKSSQKKVHTPVIPYKVVRETFSKSPKFLTARFVHEFVHFLVYEQDRNAGPIKEYDKIKEVLTKSSPNYNLNNLDNDLSVGCYDNSLSWKMFIQPLPIYKEKPTGWAYLMDIYLRLPLSIIVKMYQISKYCHPLFAEYVNDPVKQHYLVTQLPKELQEYLNNFRVSRSLIQVLKNINWIGLIQVGHRELKDSRECWLYVNRKAKILDTTISDTGYRYISSDKIYSEVNFTFNTPSDVQNYWNTLYKICLSTKLGAKMESENLKKRFDVDFLGPVEFDEAIKKDVGYIPGDNKGASGIDSNLFSHLQRNWSWRAIKKNTIKTTTRANKIRFSSQAAKMVNDKPIKLKPTQNMLKLRSKRLILKKQIKQIKHTAKKKGEYDKVDKEAINKMSCLRVSWSKDEDRMLKICRAVYIYLSGYISQLQRAINSYIFRDILHWHLNSINKTSRACQRRLRYILRHRPSSDVMTWVHELKQNSEISKRFGVNVLINLRDMYKNDAQFINILKVLYIKMVYYLNQIIQNLNEVIESKSLLPDSLNHFNSMYNEIETPVPVNDIAQIRDFSLKHLDPQNIEDIEISTINSLMHSTLCCTRDKTLYNIQIFEVYKKFKEDVLAKAYKKARDDNLVVQLKFKSGASGSKLVPISGSSLILSVKYKQQLYLDIPYEAISLCYQQFESSLQNFFVVTPTPFILKTVDAGGFYHLIELLASNQVNIEIQMPQKILTIDPNHSPSFEEETERIMDHFHSLLDSAPKTQYVKYFEEENNQNASGSRIKFNKANENYKIIYNPYDVLAKLPDNYYHFFCALDNLNKIIDLDFSRFNMDTFCPFNCILKYPDLFVNIERIVNERKHIIEELIYNSDIEDIIESIVILNQKNIMQVFERLQKVLRERNLSNDQKDFGKPKINQNKANVLTLSKEILDYTDIDLENKLEFESSMIKEDKNKSQDVYVVNLPTLKLKYNEHKEIDKDYVIYNDLTVPKQIVKNAIYRDEILKKVLSFSHWCHNGNIKQFFQSATFKRLSSREQIFTENLLNYLEKFEVGVKAYDLLEHFKDENMLVKIVSILRKNFLVMRVGVENFIYVHKNHVAPWIVNSYNIKRLDKEFLQDSEVIIKRPHSSNDIDEPPIKKEIIENDDCKRLPKPIYPYQADDSSVKIKEVTVKEKENIIIRPYPWIRVNGSLNRRVLDKWIGVILTDCLTNTGQTILTICQKFNQLHPMNLRCLLEILEDLNCIKLKVLRKHVKVTLFSSYEDILVEEEDATEFSRIEETFITTLPNAMINLSIFIGEKKYGIDFV